MSRDDLNEKCLEAIEDLIIARIHIGNGEMQEAEEALLSTARRTSELTRELRKLEGGVTV
jgi:hypothetical protein